MNKPIKTVAALCLCLSLAAGSAGVRALAAETGGAAPVQTAVSSGAVRPAAREETVYVLAGPDGAAEKVIVSSWLKNPDGAAALLDDAQLEDVENVKGPETYAASTAGRVWDAQGRDVYTQGTAPQDALPVDVTVRYTLDGQAIRPEDLAGRSGRVSIRFDYVNHAYRMMDVDGREEKIYVPFAMLTGAVLDNDRFRNVEVTNGRVYNDGDRTAVAGLAFPGLGENLQVDPEKWEAPTYVEITADVTDFQLESTFTVATASPFGALNMDRLEDAGALRESLDQLTGAMAQLLDGSDRLYAGLDVLLEKSGQLAEGVDRLAGGAAALKDGAAALSEGAIQLQNGVQNLHTGLAALDGNSAALNAGAEQVFDVLLAAANRQLTAAGAPLPAELTAENYGAILDGVLAVLPEAAAEPVAGLKASLDSYNQFYQGLRSYTAGVAQAAEGAGALEAGAVQLQEGATQLSGGAKALWTGADALQSGAPALTEGVTQLRDGAKALADGLEELNRKGVQKLVDAVDGDLEDLTARLRATAEAARDYRSFSGGGEADGQVKFIYRTAPVNREM